MEAFSRFVFGAFIGSVINLFTFYCLIVLSGYVDKGKLDLSGEWGGNFVGAVIGLIFGAVVGAVIGLIRPKPRKAMFVTAIITALLMILQGISFFSSDDYHYFIQQKNYWRITLEVIAWFLFVSIFAFNSWAIAKAVSTANRKLLN
jgi:ribose/xylose/arabinose/galactoside ABC-type transport system permease subunit